MKTGFNRFMILLVAVGLMGFAAPTTGAADKSLKLGVLAQEIELNNKDLAPGTSLHRMSLEDFGSDRLSRMDGLILGASEAQAIAADAELQARLKQFVIDGHPVFIAGGSLDPMVAIGGPALGSDAGFVDGVPVPSDQRLAGLFVNPDGSYDSVAYAFGSIEDLKAKAAGKSSSFAAAHAPRNGKVSAQQTGSTSAYWSLRATASYCVERAPYGEICYTANFYRLDLDASLDYDWWSVAMTTTSGPGAAAWGNSWRTHKTWSTADVDYYRAYNKLVDFGGPSAYNQDVLSYNIGVTAGVDGALETVRLGQAYDLDQVRSIQSSWKEYNDFYVRHELDYNSMHTSITYKSRPGFTVRVCDGCSLKVPYNNKAEFLDYTTNQLASVYINSWREIYP